MRRICKDPTCPANHPCIKRYNASTSTTTLINKKKKKEIKKQKKKLKKKLNNLNKKCQTTKSIESTTSLSICRTKTCNAIPKPTPKIICQCPKRIICKESKAKKIIDKVTPNSRKCIKIIEQSISCKCIKKSSSEDLKKLCKCSSTCTFLSKYNDCCCIREKIKKKKKDSIDYCYSNNKEKPFKGTLCPKYREQSKKNKNEYIEHRCCGNSFRNQNRIMEKRKVKFC
ncbi:uncharacterized protein LOC122716496 isoform X2 [Apis laboriosa]|uniref:uncharacterized protein LOC122716496 isoform X2 n=1 Tax=Apis laboriosa TaxID=183418 RepID=UPI001CC5D1B4|nr:uncharacterized protein LOC122716496 isoform X2 [Apis laboriosa]